MKSKPFLIASGSVLALLFFVLLFIYYKRKKAAQAASGPVISMPPYAALLRVDGNYREGLAPLTAVPIEPTPEIRDQLANLTIHS